MTEGPHQPAVSHGSSAFVSRPVAVPITDDPSRARWMTRPRRLFHSTMRLALGTVLAYFLGWLVWWVAPQPSWKYAFASVALVLIGIMLLTGLITLSNHRRHPEQSTDVLYWIHRPRTSWQFDLLALGVALSIFAWRPGSYMTPLWHQMLTWTGWGMAGFGLMLYSLRAFRRPDLAAGFGRPAKTYWVVIFLASATLVALVFQNPLASPAANETTCPPAAAQITATNGDSLQAYADRHVKAQASDRATVLAQLRCLNPHVSDPAATIPVGTVIRLPFKPVEPTPATSPQPAPQTTSAKSPASGSSRRPSASPSKARPSG